MVPRIYFGSGKLFTYEKSLLRYFQQNISGYANATSIPQNVLAEMQSGLVIATGSMQAAFNGCQKLPSIPAFKVDTSKVTNFDSAYWNNRSATSIDANWININNATTIQSMFKDCVALTSLDLSSWVGGKLTNMENAFRNLTAITSIDLSNLDTSTITRFYFAFNSCPNLTEIKGVLDFSSATNITYMFSGCSKLRGLKVRNIPSNLSGQTFIQYTGLGSNQFEIVD